MSLHLGNLSPRIRKDALQRVFRRFGSCTIQVKDKFGFVIYQYPSHAERALRTLRGKKICGERITVDWSNRQPRPLQRHSGDGRNSDLSRRKHYGSRNFTDRNLGANVEDNGRMNNTQEDSGGGRLDSAKLIEETKRVSINKEGYVGDKHHDVRYLLPEKDCTADANVPENDGRREIAVANELGNEVDFDRYVPHPGNDSEEKYEFHISCHSDSSKLVKELVERPQTDHVGNSTPEHVKNSKSKRPCHACGQVGHGMRKCPNELKRHGNRLRGLPLGRETAPKVQHSSSEEAILSRNQQRRRDHVDSAVTRSTKRVREKDYHEMNGSRREDTVFEGHNSKRMRVPVSSSVRSDFAASRSLSRSRSRSRSQRSLSGSRLRSRSLSVDSRKRSPSSISGSTSSHRKTKELKFQSVLRSTSPTTESVSTDQPLPSSHNELLIAHKESGLISSEFEFEEALVRPNAAVDNAKLDILMAAAAIESTAVPLQVEVSDITHCQNKEATGNPSIACDLHEINRSCIGQADNENHENGIISPKETTDFKSYGFVRQNDLIPSTNNDAQAHGKSHDAITRNISAGEIYLLLRNYGLEHPAPNDKDLSPQDYFGSARMWPWEIIYYRRLKKGPISTDNYARRLAQNEEYGIVDKYIRSSSGWGEETDENRRLN